MTEENVAVPVHVYFVADMSGSMTKLASDVVGGFNSFVCQQASQPGECVLTLVLFNSHVGIKVVHDAVPIDLAPELEDDDYWPQGSTPLLDAEGCTIEQARWRAASREVAGEPAESILFATFTDGLENASKDWTFEKLSTTKAACEAAGWAFTYLGVGHDAYSQASRIGTCSASTHSTDATPRGMAETYEVFSSATTTVRRASATGTHVASEDLYEDG